MRVSDVYLILLSAFVSLISGCYGDLDLGEHVCTTCLPCEACVRENGSATCRATSGFETACAEDGNIHSYDSCKEDEGIIESCPSERSMCEGDVDGEPSCVCINRWEGSNCDECPRPWDPAANCDDCLPNWDKDAQCLACLENWDVNESCLKCVGNWDMEQSCSVCRNHWMDDSDDCGTCPGNWDPLSDCSACTNHWEDNGDDCGTCPGNWDASKECKDCRGYWDLAAECEECEPHRIDEENDCGTCAPGWLGADCDTCVRFVDQNSNTDSPDGLSWETAFTTVQAGIDAAAAAPGTCEIWVGMGRYYVFEQSQLDTILLKPGTELYGGFVGDESAREERDWNANETVLDGRSLSNVDDQVNHVVTGSDNTVIDGFTLTGGNAAGTSGTDDNGGGLLADNVSPTIRNCLFQDNRSSGAGGAIFVMDTDLSISNCRFVENVSGWSGGAVGASYGSLWISESYFEANTASTGGAIQCGLGGDFFTQELTVEDSTFLHNEATEGGALASDDNVSVSRSVFIGNRSGSWGGAVDGRYLDVYRSLFVGNSASNGGAVSTTDATIINATFTGNTAWEDGAAVYTSSQNSFTRIHNTIIWDNGSNEVGGFESYLISISYSLVNETGTGNIYQDPLFTADEDTPYHLSAESPCIDAADGEVAVVPDLDGFSLADDPNIADTGYGVPRYADIGAYEYQPE